MIVVGDRTLVQFPISHYCEKARWHLDAKGLDYRVRDVLPGAHKVIAARLGARGTVPILVDDGRVLDDSSEIARHLEERYGDRGARLLPRDAEARTRVLAHEDWFDEEVGPHVRAFFYSAMLKERGGAAQVFFASYGSKRLELLRPVLGPLFEAGIRFKYKLRDDTTDTARAAIVRGFERLERSIDGDPSRYLEGDDFTLADLAAASMLAPVVAPRESAYVRTAETSLREVIELRDFLRGRCGWRWVERVYAQHRRAAPST